MTAKRVGALGVLTVVLALLGIAVPIGWNEYTSRTVLQLEVLPPLVVERDTSLARLRLLYGHQPVDRITKLRYALVNSGRTPILEETVVTPPWLDLGESTLVLEVAVDLLTPPDLAFGASLDSGRTRVFLAFPLLNPGDRAEFSILVLGNPPSVTSGARIVGLKALSVFDRSRAESSPRRHLGASFYIVVGFTAFGLLFFLLGLYFLVVETESRNLLAKGVLSWPTGGTREQYATFIGSVFHTKTASELQNVTYQVAAIPPTGTATPDQDAAIRTAVHLMAANLGEAKITIAVLGVLSAIGVLYSVAQLL